MKTIDIPSVLNPTKVAYRLTSSWPWDQRGNAPLSLYIETFETYGDGVVQHSGSWCAQFSELTDVSISFARAIVADPANEAWKQLSYVFHDISEELIRFVLSIRYREDKAQYFSIAEKKISSSEAKRHDRRWEKVESWMDGTPGTALSILLNSQPGVDWIGKLCMADDLREIAGYPAWEDIFKPVTQLKGDWNQAFRAFRAAADAVAKLDYANRVADSAIYNSTPKETVAA